MTKDKNAYYFGGNLGVATIYTSDISLSWGGSCSTKKNSLFSFDRKYVQGSIFEC